MNLSIYGLGNRHQRSWLAVDLGVSFGDEEHLPGIDLIMPDIRFLEKERKNLMGLVLTHAHEDHFGAIIDLWPKLQCTIYADQVQRRSVRGEMGGRRNPPKIPVTVVPSGGRIVSDRSTSIHPGCTLDPGIACAGDPHRGRHRAAHRRLEDRSDPDHWPTDRRAAVARTGRRRRAGTGRRFHQRGPGRPLPSEAEVADTIAKLVKAAKGRVAVTTFASNVARLKAVADAAKAADRELVVVGRAMERVVQVARETGYLEGVQSFRGADLYGHFPPDKVLALCTAARASRARRWPGSPMTTIRR